MYDYLIAGAGFAGSVVAERMATAGKKVLVIDKRNHVGGNAYDYYNKDGILIHKYGPHIFHTNSEEVYRYLSQFTEWRNYQHHVLCCIDGQMLPMPINQNTINMMYGLQLSSDETAAFLAAKAEQVATVRTSEDVVVAKVGRELYEKFFRGYTRKQWALDPSELDASVTARVPVRTNKDNRYFTDTYQVMPRHGYTAMFNQILSHPNIHVMTNADFKVVAKEVQYKRLIYTGPIDEYFDHCFGKLPYRSIDFKFETYEQPFQQVGTVNYPNDYDFTRITEFRHLTGQQHQKTTVVYEFPQAEGDPYYPIPRAENAAVYSKYQKLAATLPDIWFAGRLGTYKYYNMDQVVAQALTLCKKIMKQDASETETVSDNSTFPNNKLIIHAATTGT